MQFLRIKAITWMALLFLCLLSFISTSCESRGSANNSFTPSPVSTTQNTNTSQPVSPQSSPGESPVVATTTTQYATQTVTVAQTMTAVAVAATTTTQYATQTVTVAQTMTAVASNVNQSYPTPTAAATATPTASPQLELDKMSLHASSDCTISVNADGNNHSGWVCPLTLTNSGTTDLNWTSNTSYSNVGVYVQDTQTWNQGTVLAGQQQQVIFVVLGDTSACSGSYTLTFNSSVDSISVSWEC